MPTPNDKFKIAAVQASPVFLTAEGSVREFRNSLKLVPHTFFMVKSLFHSGTRDVHKVINSLF